MFWPFRKADRAEAGRRFDDWMRRVEGSGLSELAATARVVDSGADPQLLRRPPDQRRGDHQQDRSHEATRLRPPTLRQVSSQGPTPPGPGPGAADRV